jgi:hypothetical protein
MKRAAAIVLLLASATASLAGCSKPFVLRSDLAALPAPSRHLVGLRAAVRAVHDLRDERNIVGVHRDGLARVTQFEYRLAKAPSLSTARLLEFLLAASGATLAGPNEPADLLIEVDILSLDLTTDGTLAGEETFGEVALNVRLFDGNGYPLGQKSFRDTFADSSYEDSGLIGDRLGLTLAKVVAELPIAQRPLAATPERSQLLSSWNMSAKPPHAAP